MPSSGQARMSMVARVFEADFIYYSIWLGCNWLYSDIRHNTRVQPIIDYIDITHSDTDANVEIILVSV